MRPWITHLVSNSVAYHDFWQYTVDAIVHLNKDLVSAVRADDHKKAVGIAHEIKVYEDLQKTVKREVQERNAQLTYMNETQGGN